MNHPSEQKIVSRYFHGWFMWGRAIWMARTKRHGAGPMKWKYVFKIAASYRWIVDGQMRNGKPPRWMHLSHSTQSET